MSILIGDRPALAVGHNNVIGLIIFDWSTAEIVHTYLRPMEFTFTPYERLELSDSGQQIPIGLPKASWKYPFWNFDAKKLWTDLFMPYPAKMSQAVTLRTLDLTSNTWLNYNAMLKRPEFETFYKLTGYFDITVEFYNLRKLV